MFDYKQRKSSQPPTTDDNEYPKLKNKQNSKPFPKGISTHIHGT